MHMLQQEAIGALLLHATPSLNGRARPHRRPDPAIRPRLAAAARTGMRNPLRAFLLPRLRKRALPPLLRPARPDGTRRRGPERNDVNSGPHPALARPRKCGLRVLRAQRRVQLRGRRPRLSTRCRHLCCLPRLEERRAEDAVARSLLRGERLLLLSGQGFAQSWSGSAGRGLVRCGDGTGCFVYYG